MEKEKKNQHIRRLIVMRREAERIHRIPYLREEASFIAGTMMVYARAHRLAYELATRQF
jgi:hypothetical protein